ncbi:MAG: hypothetical protein PW788_03875 [Micavibrio sp.]|nr:hypothetical protein [Micavibrio sp.]
MSLRQPWIANRNIDLGFIIGPAFIVTLAVVALRGSIEELGDTPPWLWLLLVVGVDVSHVYSTIFRTYLDRAEMQKRRALYILAPLFAWVAGTMLYSISALAFWRVLAYLAVFHFMRQQYGFMMIYARGERLRPKLTRILDQSVIYMATLFPLLYWHCHHRNFSWFVDGDFVQFNAPLVANITAALYGAMLAAYVMKEAVFSWRDGGVNLPKNLLLLGTVLSWGVGIVVFNNDLAFTATNVIAHGIPYMALIWVYGRNQRDYMIEKPAYIPATTARLFSARMIPIYIGLLFALAFFEEGVWDGLIWREHGGIFAGFRLLPPVRSDDMMVWLVPLLSLPQSVHYILDAFIWKHNLKDSEWKKILLLQQKAS